MASTLRLINLTKCCFPVTPFIPDRWCKVSRSCFRYFGDVSDSSKQIEVPQSSPKLSDHNNRPTKDQNEAINKRIWTIPNGLCLFRIIVSPLVAYTIVNHQPVASMVICAVAGLTDFADGYIARRFESQRSTLGATLDPVADKIMISTLFISTAVSGQLPVLLTSIVIGRDLILILGSAYKRYQIMTQPRSLSQFFSLKGLNLEVKSSMISKWNTTFQFTLITLTVAAPLINMTDSILLTYLQYLVATTTIVSGADYILNKDNYISLLKNQ